MLPLAFGAAISPILLVAIVFILSGKTKPLSRSFAFLLGASITLGGVTTVFLLLVKAPIGPGDSSSGSDAVSTALRGFAALILLGLGVRNLRHRGEPPNKKRAERIQGSKTRAFVVIGLVVMLSNVTTLVLYIPALHMISSSNISDTDQAIALILLFTITMLPLLIPLAVTLAAGPKSGPMLANLNQFVTKHNAVINATVCFGFAAYLGYAAIAPAI